MPNVAPYHGLLWIVQNSDRCSGYTARLGEYGGVESFARVPSVVENFRWRLDVKWKYLRNTPPMDI